MTVFAIMLGAALCATNGEPAVAEIRNVRFHSPRLVISREHADSSSAFVHGQIRVDMSFAKATARKPLLRITALCERDGSLVCYDGFWGSPRTFRRVQQSEISDAFKQSRREPAPKDRERAYRDPALITCCLPEVSRTAFAATTYGESKIGRGFFRLNGTHAQAKVLVFRLELWQNGVLVGSYDSPKTGLGKYELPSDWYVWKKYPQKFRYEDGN